MRAANVGSAEFPALDREGYAGKKLGRFDVMAKLGVGGMSEVFLAWQNLLKLVAQKTLQKSPRLTESSISAESKRINVLLLFATMRQEWKKSTLFLLQNT